MVVVGGCIVVGGAVVVVGGLVVVGGGGVVVSGAFVVVGGLVVVVGGGVVVGAAVVVVGGPVIIEIKGALHNGVLQQLTEQDPGEILRDRRRRLHSRIWLQKPRGTHPVVKMGLSRIISNACTVRQLKLLGVLQICTDEQSPVHSKHLWRAGPAVGGGVVVGAPGVVVGGPVIIGIKGALHNGVLQQLTEQDPKEILRDRLSL